MILRAVHFDVFVQEQQLKDLLLGLDTDLVYKMDQLKFIQDKNRRGFGYYLIRNCIHEITGIYTKTWTLNGNGKPVYSGIAFNVSHDGEFVVIVAQKDIGNLLKLGVDVCFLKEIQVLEFRDYLSCKELDWIQCKTGTIGFYMVWALKEATTKGIGDGMGLDFKRLEFIITVNDGNLRIVQDIIGFMDGKRMDWDFSIQFLDKEHVVAVASSCKLLGMKDFEIEDASKVLEKIKSREMISQEFRVKKVVDKKEWELAYDVRVKVFVKEQNVPQENELDELDPECVHWIVLTGDEKVVGTIRLYVDPTGKKGKLGRMAVLKEYRRRGIGKMLIKELVDYAKEFTEIQKIVCHSQEYIQDFYKSCGFKVESPEIFMEEGIPHVLMTRLIQ